MGLVLELARPGRGEGAARVVRLVDNRCREDVALALNRPHAAGGAWTTTACSSVVVVIVVGPVYGVLRTRDHACSAAHSELGVVGRV